MTNQSESMELYQMIRENRMAMYSKPRRYYNREGEKGSAFKFLFLVEVMVFFMLAFAAGNVMAQEVQQSPMMHASAYSQQSTNIYNYTTVYNSGKVFLNWTAKEEPADCIYIVERSADGRQFESVGVKEGIGTNVELFYSWMDHNPPGGFAYYRVKKIAKDGTQFYSATNTIINQGSSFNPKSNYAQGDEPPVIKQ
ncbi:MAG: hypothetical protein BWY67_01421 [Bacteroidetes bacterium ADurb.Bin397]|jgi:hypothetical protein|nr:hypothetical protein [Bacteroidia bacterium]OQA08904.1 MAG: hypothetical protein BWY67_01421 [Bacteroidetes bacterium ADurb.Bin397]